MKRVFIDSNVWFSAFYKKGVCSRLLRHLYKKSWEVVISELALDEIIRNIKEKIPNALMLIVEYIERTKPVVVKNPSKEKLMKFESLVAFDDLPILISAIEYDCDYFITGNIKDFEVDKIKNKFGLRVMTPSDFFKLL